MSMKRMGAVFLAGLLFLFVVAATGCEQKKAYVDGSYRAEFKDFDSFGYKDYLEITVEGGLVVSVVFNGINEAGGLKSEDEAYRAEMEKAQGTNPSKYSSDVINQFLEQLDIEKVDIVAGATYSTNCFKALFFALEPNMEKGDTSLVLVDNVSM